MAAQRTDAGDADKDIKAGLELFLNRLEQVRKPGRMERETESQYAAKECKTAVSDSEKLKSAVEVVYLTITNRIAESDALMKVCTLGDKLRGVPVTLLTHIADLIQQNSASSWASKLGTDRPGWEDRGKAAARLFATQLKTWVTLAGKRKALNTQRLPGGRHDARGRYPRRHGRAGRPATRHQ